MKVTLEWFEVFRGAFVGIARTISVMRKGLRKNVNVDDGRSEWETDIEGACGEIAFAKATGRYWSGSVDTFKKDGDVGEIQIRTTRKNKNSLIVRDRDRDGDTFVLVVGEAPHFDIVGWIIGREAKREEWMKAPHDGTPAYFVPQNKLHSIESLGSLINR